MNKDYKMKYKGRTIRDNIRGKYKVKHKIDQVSQNKQTGANATIQVYLSLSIYICR